MAGKNSKAVASKSGGSKKVASNGDDGDSFDNFLDAKLSDYPEEKEAPDGPCMLVVRGTTLKPDKHGKPRINVALEYKQATGDQEIDKNDVASFKRLFRGFDTTNAGDMQQFKDLCLSVNVDSKLTTRQVIEKGALKNVELSGVIARTADKNDPNRIYVNVNNLHAPVAE